MDSAVELPGAEVLQMKASWRADFQLKHSRQCDIGIRESCRFDWEFSPPAGREELG